MLCENKIRPQFNFGINMYCSFHFRAAIFESFGYVEGLVFSFKVGRYILCDPTDNFDTSGTSRIYYSANAE